VKVTPSDDDIVLNQAENEFAIIKELDHPNVIKGYQGFRSNVKHTCHTVMKYFEGNELISQVCKERDSSYCESDVKAIFKQILTGLDYLHKGRVSHRDIKPQNILVSENMREVCIIDFNVAKKAEEQDLFIDKYGNGGSFWMRTS